MNCDDRYPEISKYADCQARHYIFWGMSPTIWGRVDHRFRVLHRSFRLGDYERKVNHLAYDHWQLQTWARGLSSPKILLSPHRILVKIHQVNCVKFSKIGRFCSQKNVNNVCKLLQLLGDFDFIGFIAPNENSWRPTACDAYVQMSFDVVHFDVQLGDLRNKHTGPQP